MVKSSLLLVLSLVVVFITSLRFSDTIQGVFLSFTDTLKNSYTHSSEAINEWVTLHTFQKSTIKELESRVEELEMESLHNKESEERLKDIYKALKDDYFHRSDIELVRSISYLKLGDFSRIWIDYDGENSDKIYGLIQNGYAAGVVVNQNGRFVGLLNGAEKCSYGVYVGEDEAPGIIKSNSLNTSEILVDYIPSWMSVEIGDEVITSGLDNIFFKGIKVGVVKSVKKSQGYKIATITQYANTLNPSYFWLTNLKNNQEESKKELNISIAPMESI